MGRPRKDAATAAKTQSSRLSRPPYAMPLDTIGNVRRELGRLYRASLSGKLESAEAARLAFILKEIRASLEVEAESPVIDIPAGGTLGPVIIYSIPRGHRINHQTGLIEGPDGEPAPPLQELQPYAGTPPLAMFPAPVAQFDEPEPPLPVMFELEAAPPSVTRLDRWRDRKRAGDDDEGPGVA